MDNVWWTQVSNAVRFVSDIRQALAYGESIVIYSSTPLPWRDDFADIIEEKVNEVNADKTMMPLDADEYEGTEPGKVILDRCCSHEKRAEYRPAKGFAKFFAENEDIVVHDRFFWIRIHNDEQLMAWSKLASEYLSARGKNKNKKASFILEYSGEDRVSPKKGIKVFSLDEYINAYDRIVFAVASSSYIRDTEFIKSYTAELVSNVVGNRIELAEKCISRYEKFLNDPYAMICEIAAKEKRSDGSDFEYDLTQEEVANRVWKAQIRTVYPRIEEYRASFVKKHNNILRSNIAKAKTLSSTKITADNPEDLEIGNLRFMSDNSLLGNITIDEHDEIARYATARNHLSHLETMTLSEIRELNL